MRVVLEEPGARNNKTQARLGQKRDGNLVQEEIFLIVQ